MTHGRERSFRGWSELADLMSDDDEFATTMREIYLEGR